MSKAITLDSIAKQLGAELVGDGDVVIQGVSTLEGASETDISFLTNAKYKQHLATTKAIAVIASEDMRSELPSNGIISSNPHAAFARVAQMFYTPPRPAIGIAESARISSSAKIAEGVTIGENVVIDSDVVIKNGTVIGHNCVIGEGTVIGENCHLHANVTLYHGVTLGDDVVIHSQTEIGSDGFGFANENGTWIPIPQFGGVRVGDDTNIGAGCTIDRGALDDTVIGTNVIIDNQVHIAHNCVIGDHSCICGKTGMAGSVIIGKYVVIAGQCAINGHISICDKVQITGNTMVTADITEPGVYSSGQPAMPNREWRKTAVRHRQLPELFDRVKRLEKGQ